MTGIESPALAERQPHQHCGPSASDWEMYRDIIAQMYSHHSLKEVVSKMASEHNFVATERMYKTRIRQWHLNKNMKSHEMHALAQRARQRSSAGEDTAFQVRGNVVPRSKVERYIRRHKKDLGRGRSASVMTAENLNGSSPSIWHEYRAVPIVEKDVRVTQPPANTEAENGTSAETLDITLRQSPQRPPFPILNETLVESPGQEASSTHQVMDHFPISAASVGVHASLQNPAAGSSRTSIACQREQRGTICRCKMHTDACDRSQFAFGAENCETCKRCFSWTNSALPYITTSQKGFLCRCKWHDRACRTLQEDYDARKCSCCKGWLAFSEQANHLIKSPIHTGVAYWNPDPHLGTYRRVDSSPRSAKHFPTQTS